MASQLGKFKRGPLVACLTCPLCSKLLREATTICVCLHTFCKKCIYEKFEDDDMNCCPICDVYLGSLPHEKLRPDNNLQDVRNKLFPMKKIKDSEGPSSVAIHSRRKERSLSSLVVGTEPVSTAGNMKRTRGVSRRAVASRGNASKRQVDISGMGKVNFMDRTRLSSVPKRQRVSGNDEAELKIIREPKRQVPSNRSDEAGSWETNPLDVLAETADRTLTGNLSVHALKTNNAENGNSNKPVIRTKRVIKRRGNAISLSLKRRSSKVLHHAVKKEREKVKCEPDSPEKASTSGKSRVFVGSRNGYSDIIMERSQPIWFALFAYQDQTGNSYPQIPKCYIRIKDGSIPVSYIKRYLVEKLKLRHESEVEVTCCDQLVGPSLPLRELVDIWVNNVNKIDANSHSLPTNDENSSSIPEYVMILKYRKKPV